MCQSFDESYTNLEVCASLEVS
ncbi:MAG: hypothetical protein H6Q39_1328, partial [Chloroflexi bacterium]|nr:hypothetical protein [Chloroflexota bacterium]